MTEFSEGSLGGEGIREFYYGAGLKLTVGVMRGSFKYYWRIFSCIHNKV